MIKNNSSFSSPYLCFLIVTNWCSNMQCYVLFISHAVFCTPACIILKPSVYSVHERPTVPLSPFASILFFVSPVHIHPDPSGGADSRCCPKQTCLDVGRRNGSQWPGSLYWKWGCLDPRAHCAWRGSAGNGPGPVRTWSLSYCTHQREKKSL